MVRAIITAQLRERFQAQRRALDPNADARPYWQNRPVDAKKELAERQLYREQQKRLRELLGDDAESSDDVGSLYRQQRLASVPADKVNAVKKTQSEFDDRAWDLSVAGASFNQDKFNLLEKSRHEALEQILTPAEMTEYDLRTSNTANELRYRLSAFDPTEAEFRAIFPLQREYDEKFSFAPGVSRQDAEARQTAQKELTDNIKTLLGPDRAAEYTRGTDYGYIATAQLVSRLELPAETAGQLFDLQKDIQQKRSAVYADKSLSKIQRDEQMNILIAEATTKATAALGAQGAEAYKQYGGQWIQQLKPRQVTRP